MQKRAPAGSLAAQLGQTRSDTPTGSPQRPQNLASGGKGASQLPQRSPATSDSPHWEQKRASGRTSVWQCGHAIAS
jgi:hypothetical protein